MWQLIALACMVNPNITAPNFYTCERLTFDHYTTQDECLEMANLVNHKLRREGEDQSYAFCIQVENNP